MTEMQGEPTDPSEKPMIELNPPTPANSLPPGNRFEDRWIMTEQRIDPATTDSPVPAVPVHLCPTCDYILTGLTARRCPECGEAFTLPEARDRGVAKSMGFRRYFATQHYEQWKLRAGWALLVAGLVYPMVHRGTANWWPQLYVGVRGGIMLVFLPIFLTFACFYKVLRGTTWADAILLVGLAVALFSAAMSLL